MFNDESKVGYLVTVGQSMGVVGLCCASGTGVAIYRENIYPYRQSCANCGQELVLPQTSAWPILFEPTMEDFLDWSGVTRVE